MFFLNLGLSDSGKSPLRIDPAHQSVADAPIHTPCPTPTTTADSRLRKHTSLSQRLINCITGEKNKPFRSLVQVDYGIFHLVGMKYQLFQFFPFFRLLIR
jgi:hypothetical protein